MYYGSSSEAKEFFAQAGYPCPQYTNPADHMLDIITNSAPPSEEHEDRDRPSAPLQTEPSTRLIALAKHLKTDSASRLQKEEPGSTIAEPKRQSSDARKRPSWFYQFKVLLRRSFKEQLRARTVMITQLIQSIFIAILIGLVFLQIGQSQSSIIRSLWHAFRC